jgi:hypothetical protein
VTTRTTHARKSASTVGELQRWFQAAILHPRGAHGAARDARVKSLLPRPARTFEQVILPSSELTARERLEIYASSYYLRLRDVLKSDFAGVAHALGWRGRDDEPFDRLVREYVTIHPSTSFTLNDLGGRFARFVARESRTREVVRHRDFLGELAALERSLDEVFHERHVEPVDVAKLRSIPVARWSGARFEFHPSVRLFAFDHPVGRYLQDVYEKKSPRLPAKHASWMLVHRRDWRVWRVQLSQPQFDLLTRLRREPLGRALAKVVDSASFPIGDWFREWTSDGLFTAIRVR